jgi:hypothetical protein
VVHVRPDAVVASVAVLDPGWRAEVFLGSALLPRDQHSPK